MVPGMSERDLRATELRRRDLLAECERARALPRPARRHPRPDFAADRWGYATLSAALGRAAHGLGTALHLRSAHS